LKKKGRETARRGGFLAEEISLSESIKLERRREENSENDMNRLMANILFFLMRIDLHRLMIGYQRLSSVMKILYHY
jgi:hypothetical protein